MKLIISGEGDKKAEELSPSGEEIRQKRLKQ